MANSNILYMFKDTTPAKVPEPKVPSSALEMALNIVSHAHENGLVMAPGAANAEMIAAAQAISDLPEEEIQKIWQAMLQAW